MTKAQQISVIKSNMTNQAGIERIKNNYVRASWLKKLIYGVNDALIR